MSWIQNLLRSFGCLLLIVVLPLPASAFCDLLEYSGTGLSDQEALKKANAAGMHQVLRLNSAYGVHVKYEKATTKCSPGSHVTCTITQRYCVAGLDDTTASHKCGEDEVWLGGKCVLKSGGLKEVIVPHGCPSNLDKVCYRTSNGQLAGCHCQS